MAWHLVTKREASILEILVPREKYGLQIAEEYEGVTGTAMRIGSLYTTMDRMQEKGLVDSRIGDSNPDRGGNRRRFFMITLSGKEALAEYLAAEPIRIRNAGLVHE